MADFESSYTVTVPEGTSGTLCASFQFPAADAIYDGFHMTLGGRGAEPTWGCCTKLPREAI